jgi:hypothetical protein
MKFERLIDASADQTEQTLLRAAKSEQLSDGARRRIVASFGLGGAGAMATPREPSSSASVSPVTQSAAPGASGAKLSFLHAVTVKWVGLCALGVIPVAAVVARHTRADVLATAQRSGSETASVPHEIAAVEPVPAHAQPLSVQDATTPHDVAAPRRLGRTPSAHGEATASLAQQVAALQSVRAALDGGDATAALAGLDEYRRKFNPARLAHEAMALRIEALAMSGDRAAAAALAGRFDAAYPQSPYRARLRSILSAEGR